MLRSVEHECSEELEKILIGHGCDADEGKVNLCDGLLTIVEVIYTSIVDNMCDKLPDFLYTIIPICQVRTSMYISMTI